MKKYVLFASIFANVILSVLILKMHYGAHHNKSLKKIESTQTLLSEKEIKAKLFRELPVKAGSIVFIGDSHTELFPTSLLDKDVFKEGIAGDTTDGLLQRLDRIVESKPKKIFIEIGHNDLSRDKSPKYVVANISKIINQFPNSEIYVTSVLPCNLLTKSGKPINRLDNITNALLKNLCQSRHATFIDLYSQLVKGTGLDPNYDCGDRTHLSYQGYRVWANILNKTL